MSNGSTIVAKRITPEEIVEAYAVTGMTPIRQNYTKYGNCGCPIIALAESRGFRIDKTIIDSFLGPVEYIARVLGYDWNYLSSFVCGFDGCGEEDSDGWRDGVAVANRILWRGL